MLPLRRAQIFVGQIRAPSIPNVTVRWTRRFSAAIPALAPAPLNASEPVELTKQLVAHNTIEREQSCADEIGTLLVAHGFDVNMYAFAEGRPSIVASLDGFSSAPPLVLTGHIDVVPLGGRTWSKDPWAGEVDGDKLYGRGTCDMKGGIAAMLVSAIQLAKGPRPARGLTLVITAGEEVACKGAFHLASLGDALGKAGAILVAEPTANDPLVGHKGVLWLTATATGITAHSSCPHLGDNAIAKAAKAVCKLQAEDHFPLPSLRPDSPNPVLGAPTLNIGTMKGGLNLNSVPDAASFTIDCRTPPEVDHTQLRQAIQHAVGPDVVISTDVDLPPVLTCADDEWVQRVFDIAQRHSSSNTRPTPRGATYFTDAAALRPAYGAETPTVIMGPGEVSQAHQTDEWVEMDKVRQCTEMYSDIVMDYCHHCTKGKPKRE